MNDPERPRRWAPRPAVEHQLAGRPGRRHPASLSGLQRNRRPGAADSIRSTRRSSGAACRPGESQYHALEVVLERRFSRGLQSRFGYTYSKLNNNGAESGQGDKASTAGVQNPADPLDWELSADDTPHVFLTGFTWEMPGSRSWTSAVTKALLAGWNVSGILRYESGRPLNITMNNDLGGLLFNGQKRPEPRGGVDGVAADGDFDPNTDSYFNRAAWTDPGPLAFGNAPKRDDDGARVPGLQRGPEHLQGLPRCPTSTRSGSSRCSATSSTGRCSATRTRT